MDGEIRRALEACARDFPENFEWLGPVDSETRDGLLSGADLFLFPTRYANEAQPLVLIEALEAGVPVLANDRGCIGDMLGRDSQWLVADEAASVDTATATIERMLDDDGYRAAARVMALQRAAALAAHASGALEDFAREL
jgi:glycosyltransferase involved in cell wall biosynthesis